MNTSVKIDSEFAALIPAADAEEMSLLRDSLEREGCRDPLLTWNGLLIDGHNRYAFCQELGIAFKTLAIEFPDRQAAMEFIINNQRGRRNLTTSQKAVCYDKLAALPQGNAASEKDEKGRFQRNNPNASKGAPGKETQTQAAKNAGISRRTVQRARVVSRKPAIAESVKAGTISVSAAEKKVRAAEASAPAVPTDEIGNPIPPELIDAFAARERFDKALALMTQISTILNPLLGDPAANVGPIAGGHQLAHHRQEFIRLMQDARSHVTFGRPHCLCPYPHTESKNYKCNACKNSGWVTKTIYSNAPREYRKAVSA